MLTNFETIRSRKIIVNGKVYEEQFNSDTQQHGAEEACGAHSHGTATLRSLDRNELLL